MYKLGGLGVRGHPRSPTMVSGVGHSPSLQYSISVIETDLSPIPSVGLSVCLSVQSVLWQRLIGSGCCLGWLVGSVEGLVY